MKELVCGIGFNDGVYPASSNGKHLKEYNLWHSMLERCSSKFWKRCPTYEGVSCSSSFKSYSSFYEWCQEQIGFGNIDDNGNVWQLDKDILIKGNKLYSEDTCVFVPHNINQFHVKSNNIRGNQPIGVYFDKSRGKFMARFSSGNNIMKNLGRFETEHEAFTVYKAAKEKLSLQLAEAYKDRLDPRAYQALLDYRVEITD